MIKEVDKLEPGSILSESSHYIIKRISGCRVWLTHYESGEEVEIGKGYLKNYTNSADLYDKVVEITKEDKKDGTPGIRTIFDSIHSGQVFTVCFKKQDKPRSKKSIEQQIDTLVEKFSSTIDKVKENKKGVANTAKSMIEYLIRNPISTIEEGEDRVLRGYKIQFESRDGRYNCVDMDIERTEKESGVRPVNINQIKYLVFNGVKYIVK